MMIYIDSCIPMYLVGAEHPLKTRVMELISSLLTGSAEFITSAEVFQEIIHRYAALKDPRHLSAAYAALEEMAPLVLEVRKEDTDKARGYVSEFPGLSSRDCLHLAIMKRQHCRKIWTYDTRFDSVPFAERIQ